jgi:hypothetical protein
MVAFTVRLDWAIAVAMAIGTCSCSGPPPAEPNAAAPPSIETPGAGPVVAQEPGTDIMYVGLELSNYEVEVGEYPVVKITVRAPLDNDACIIRFDSANQYDRLGVALYGPDGKRIPDNRPRVQLPRRLGEAHELIIKAGAIEKGEFKSYVAPQVPGYHLFQVDYSPSWVPARYLNVKFRINVVPKKNAPLEATENRDGIRGRDKGSGLFVESTQSVGYADSVIDGV